MTSTGGYRSPVDLGIGQIPLTTDPELFNELTEVYNACHILNQYLDQLRILAEGGSGGSGQTPSESMPFNRFFVSTALNNIALGSTVSPSTAGSNGVLSGALAHDYGSTSPECNFCGIALTAASAGQDVRVGVGPAAIALPGAASGSIIWAFPSRATNGNSFGDGSLSNGNPGARTNGSGTAYPMPVGICIVDGYALFGQFIKR